MTLVFGIDAPRFFEIRSWLLRLLEVLEYQPVVDVSSRARCRNGPRAAVKGSASGLLGLPCLPRPISAILARPRIKVPMNALAACLGCRTGAAVIHTRCLAEPAIVG